MEKRRRKIGQRETKEGQKGGKGAGNKEGREGEEANRLAYQPSRLTALWKNAPQRRLYLSLGSRLRPGANPVLCGRKRGD